MFAGRADHGTSLVNDSTRRNSFQALEVLLGGTLCPTVALGIATISYKMHCKAVARQGSGALAPQRQKHD